MKLNQIKIQDYWFDKIFLPDVIASYGNIPRGSRAYEVLSDYLRSVRRRFLEGVSFIFVEDVDREACRICKMYGISPV